MRERYVVVIEKDGEVVKVIENLYADRRNAKDYADALEMLWYANGTDRNRKAVVKKVAV